MASPASCEYGPELALLLADGTAPELGIGRPSPDRGRMLSAMTPERLCAPHSVVDRSMAQSALSGLWLYFDFLAESHQICQEIENSTGSYWHAILHRREGDFSNARYWLRRAVNHPAWEAIGERLEQDAERSKAEDGKIIRELFLPWDPSVLVDACEARQNGRVRFSGGWNPDGILLRDIALREWEGLFQFSFRAATGLSKG